MTEKIMYSRHFPTLIRSRLNRYAFRPNLPILFTQQKSYSTNMPSQDSRNITSQMSDCSYQSFRDISSCRTLCSRAFTIEPSLTSLGRNEKLYVYNPITGNYSKRLYACKSETYNQRDREAYRLESAPARSNKIRSKYAMYNCSSNVSRPYRRESYKRSSNRPHQRFSHDTERYRDKSYSYAYNDGEGRSFSDYSDAKQSQDCLDALSHCSGRNSKHQTQVSTSYKESKRCKSVNKSLDYRKCRVGMKAKCKVPLLTRLLNFGKTKLCEQKTQVINFDSFLEESEPTFKTCASSVHDYRKEKLCHDKDPTRHNNNLESVYKCKQMDKSSDYSDLMKESETEKNQRHALPRSNISSQSRNTYTQKRNRRNNYKDERLSRKMPSVHDTCSTCSKNMRAYEDFCDKWTSSDDEKMKKPSCGVCERKSKIKTAKKSSSGVCEKKSKMKIAKRPSCGVWDKQSKIKMAKKPSCGVCEKKSKIKIERKSSCGVCEKQSRINIEKKSSCGVCVKKSKIKKPVPRRGKSMVEYVRGILCSPKSCVEDSCTRTNKNTSKSNRKLYEPVFKRERKSKKKCVKSVSKDSRCNKEPRCNNPQKNTTDHCSEHTKTEHCPERHKSKRCSKHIKKEYYRNHTKTEYYPNCSNERPLTGPSNTESQSCFMQTNNAKPLSKRTLRSYPSQEFPIEQVYHHRTSIELLKRTDRKARRPARNRCSHRPTDSKQPHRPLMNLRSHSHKAPHGYKPIVRLRF